jgi:hypothetical protein
MPWRCIEGVEHPVDRRLGGPQSQSGHGGEEKNSKPLPGLEPPIIQPVAQCYTTELFWYLTVTCIGRNNLMLFVTMSIWTLQYTSGFVLLVKLVETHDKRTGISHLGMFQSSQGEVVTGNPNHYQRRFIFSLPCTNKSVYLVTSYQILLSYLKL